MVYWFSENLKRIRKEKGMSQRDLAKRINVSQVIICAWEGNLKYPLLDKVYDVANALDTDITELLKEPEKSQ